ncbi:50S ribosomal protein L25/general stress protein Ctc [Psychromicrobium xiongbiense]|uniref:50S ribosomal protein L25/general stress protein Ctc n=1 Tax=Psychromicrobium xiongbiense TaxID=3051184 RepID=UPI002555E1A4|nr:50S ribosomal protein L25/general stress protein Ctc [Psychromicrobium sp. YIM S02556]
MSETKLAAKLRTEFGKGYARRARAAGHIPAVIYGHGAEPIHLTLPERETARAIRTANALLTIDLEGAEHLALVKDVQRDPVLQIIEHIDLLTVRKGEKVTVEIALVLVGEPQSGTVVNQEATHVTVEAEATHLPTQLEANIEGFAAGQHLVASDLVLPQGTTLVSEPDTLIINITEAAAAEDEETEAAAE